MIDAAACRLAELLPDALRRHAAPDFDAALLDAVREISAACPRHLEPTFTAGLAAARRLLAQGKPDARKVGSSFARAGQFFRSENGLPDNRQPAAMLVAVLEFQARRRAVH